MICSVEVAVTLLTLRTIQVGAFWQGQSLLVQASSMLYVNFVPVANHLSFRHHRWLGLSFRHHRWLGLSFPTIGGYLVRREPDLIAVLLWRAR